MGGNARAVACIRSRKGEVFCSFPPNQRPGVLLLSTEQTWRWGGWAVGEHRLGNSTSYTRGEGFCDTKMLAFDFIVSMITIAKLDLHLYIKYFFF